MRQTKKKVKRQRDQQNQASRPGDDPDDRNLKKKKQL